MTITIQSTYLTSYVAGFPGMLADGNTTARPTGTIEDSAGVAFGKAVFQGTNDRGLTATPGTKFKGITIADAGVVPPIGGTADIYPQYASASLCDMGDIFVLAGSNTTPGAAAYVTSGGVFTATSSGNTAIPATFMETVVSGQPVKLRVVQQ
jgi:hypothetical protein